MNAHCFVIARCTRVIVSVIVALSAADGAAWAARPPAVLFTDVVTGPVTGGVHGLGAPLAIFGTGFGASRGTSRVTIGGVEVASYLVWGERNAHSSMLDLIVVEPGPSVSGGAVVVTVAGQMSATSSTFTAIASEVYVIAPAGSDAASCRLSAPCKTIAHVATSVMQPGDVLLVRGGAYDEGEIWIRDDHGHSGTAARPKVIARYPGEEPVFGNAARPFIVDAHYIVVSGLRFENGKSLGIGWDSTGRSGNRLVDNTFIGVVDWDAIGLHGDDNVLAGNVCQVSGSTVGTQGHCYYISFGRGNTLQYNIGAGAPGYGIHVFDQRRQTNDIRRVIADLTLEGNIVSGSTERSGMILAMADEGGAGNVIDGVIVRNNIFVGNNHLGLVVTGLVRNVQILNNTFYRNGRQGLHIASEPTVSGVTIQNNLFDEGPNAACTSNCSWYQPAHLEVGGLAQSVSIANNYFSGGTPKVIGGVDVSPVTGPVRFLDPAAMDFRIGDGSAVIDAGLAQSRVPRDYTGLPRPWGAGMDIGAFEFDAGDVAPSPVAALLLSGGVSGRTITLQWQATGATLAGTVDLEARDRPNGHVVATARVAGTSIAAPGVGDGAYYVRAAGVTTAGTWLVSSQLRLVVGTPCEPPDAPVGFGATVSGNVVRFQWTLIGPTATTVELAAGYAGGRTDVGPVSVGTAPIAVAVPSARYFVRARARNACGVSPFSPEVELVVG